MNFTNVKRWSGVSWRQDSEIDRGVVAGVVLSFVLIGIGIAFSGHVLEFVNIPGLIIVLGGTFGATLIHFSYYDITQCWQALRKVLFVKEYHPTERIELLTRLSHSVRTEGLLVLERTAQRTGDPFLRMAFELTVDGQSHDEVKRLLETEIRTSNDRSGRAINVFETMGTYAPALGLIGTLIGLIQMLGTLNDPTSVGPAMAVALLTTLYGAILANLVFLPIAGKLRNKQEEEALVKAITIEGVISLGKQENPMVLEQRLQSFLPLKAA